MSGFNRAILLGRLGKDPDTRTTTSGSSVTTFSVATDETWKDKTTGERKQRTEWHNIVVFNEALGKIAQQYLKKGDQVHLEGEISHREYTDKEGVKRRTDEIVLNRFGGTLTLIGGGGQRPAPSENDYGQTTTRSTSAPTQSTSQAIDDDIPF